LPKFDVIFLKTDDNELVYLTPEFICENSASIGRVSLTDLLTYLFTPWSRVLLEKPTSFQLVKKFPAFLEPECSLPHSQVPATCHYPGPTQFSPCHHIPHPEDPT